MKKAKNEPGTISVDSLGAISNLSRRRLYALAESNVIPKPTRGAFPRDETLRRLFASYQREGATLTRERTLKLAAERRLAEIEVARAEKTYAPVSEFNKNLDDFAEVVKQSIRDSWECSLIPLVQGLIRKHVPESEQNAACEEVVKLVQGGVDTIFCAIARAVESAHEHGAEAPDETSIDSTKSNTNESDD